MAITAPDHSPIARYLRSLYERFRTLEDGDGRHLHPRARRCRPALVRDQPGDRGRLRLRGRRYAPGVHDPVDLQALRLRARPRGPGQTRRAPAHRRRAHRRRVQRDQPRVQLWAPAESHDQRGGDRGIVARGGRFGRGPLGAHPRAVLAVRGAAAQPVRGGLPVRARDGPSQSRDQPHAAELLDHRARSRARPRSLLPTVLDRGELPRSRDHRRDAGEGRCEPRDPRSRDPHRERGRGPLRHDDVRHVRLCRRVGLPGRPAGQERRRGRHSRRDAGPARDRRVLAAARRAREQRARSGRVRSDVRGPRAALPARTPPRDLGGALALHGADLLVQAQAARRRARDARRSAATRSSPISCRAI